jgi:hypothetical protein
LVALAGRTRVLDGIGSQAYVDIDSLLRPVYGHAKQGAGYGHSKVVGRQVLRKGLSPLATTISTDTAAPVLAGIRLRGGSAGSGRGAASMVTEAVSLARQAGASGEILVRRDSAYGSSAVVRACREAGVPFSVVLAKNRAVTAAIESIGDRLDPGGLSRRGHRPRHRCAGQRRRGRRGGVHRVHVDRLPGHRQAGRAPGPRQGRAVLHLPEHWPWARRWLAIWHGVFGTHPPPAPA